MLDLYEANRERLVDDYWFLDFEEKPVPRWVRMSFLTWNQVIRVLSNLQTHQATNRLHNLISNPSFEDVDWGSVRICSERELDELVDENGNTDTRAKDAAAFVGVCTKREYLFGAFYQGYADMVRSGEIDPAEMHKNWKDEPLVDYDEVEQEIREEYESKMVA
jgi:hypothetical protein